MMENFNKAELPNPNPEGSIQGLDNIKDGEERQTGLESKPMPVEVELDFLERLAPLYKEMRDSFKNEVMLHESDLKALKSTGYDVPVEDKVNELKEARDNASKFQNKFVLAQIRIAQLKTILNDLLPVDEPETETAAEIKRKREAMRRGDTVQSAAELKRPVNQDDIDQLNIEIAVQESIVNLPEMSPENRELVLATLAGLQVKRDRLVNELNHANPDTTLDPAFYNGANTAILKAQLSSAEIAKKNTPAVVIASETPAGSVNAGTDLPYLDTLIQVAEEKIPSPESQSPPQVSEGVRFENSTPVDADSFASVETFLSKDEIERFITLKPLLELEKEIVLQEVSVRLHSGESEVKEKLADLKSKMASFLEASEFNSIEELEKTVSVLKIVNSQSQRAERTLVERMLRRLAPRLEKPKAKKAAAATFQARNRQIEAEKKPGFQISSDSVSTRAPLVEVPGYLNADDIPGANDRRYK